MAKLQDAFQIKAGLTNSNYTTNTNAVKVDPNAQATIVATATVAGAPSAAYLEYTLDRQESIDAGTATWVSDYTTAKAADFGDTARGPVTGIRLRISASGGTWTLKVLQVHNANLLP